MNIEVLAKVAAILFGAVTAWNVIIGLLKSRKNQLREEYKFARDFLVDLDGVAGKSEFLRQRGCYALTGQPDMEFSALQYLWDLPNPAQAIQDYALGFKYLEHTVTASPEAPLGFVRRYRKPAFRSFLKSLYAVLYFATYLLACSPLLLQVFGLWGSSSPFLAFIVTCSIFLPMAVLSLKSRVRIIRAERLVEHQCMRSNTSFKPNPLRGFTF